MIYDLMASRRSIRKFQVEVPNKELIEQLIEAAITAPSASNKQPWRFLIVTSPTVKEQLYRAVHDAVELIAGHVDSHFEQGFRAYGDYFTRFNEAPIVIIPLFRPLSLLSNMVDDELEIGQKNDIIRMEYESGLVSTSLAIQNLLLMAHELGLGASGMTGPLVALKKIRRILSLPTSWGVVAFIPVGFPGEEPDAPPRKQLRNVIKWIE
ncbi:MAG: nitroreductase family protein [Candidatus Neomarinimicrobiota bacterium]